ncbi:hypothetical protein ACKUB1_09885 [Methanospirillum stamsii]|uniref:Nucleotide-binding protein n=1 Tax=Methanospirillum stamsii TaxID=1277351 RepID=A0A2V2N7G1_9EURY|nr:hypothetical protein [Methanospirillum stamsii]PWR71203.1 hypothetical protein DLD82_13670 [Methanospirillum stamsii]
MELKEIADRISEKFAAEGHIIDRAKLEEKINRFVEEFSVPPAEAERSIIGDYARQFGMEIPSASPPRQDADAVTLISEIQAEQWVTVEGQIVTLIPSRSPSVAQSGVISDQSGTMRFTVWAKANAPVMEQGKWYRLESAVADEYNGQVSLKVHSGTTITELSPESVPETVITAVSEIKPKRWIAVEGEVTTLFPPRSPSIAQSGILADNSGTIRFTVWASANAPLLEQGHWYHLELVESDEFNGQVSIKVHAGTKITPVSKDELPQIEKTPVGQLKPGVALVHGKVVTIEKQPSEQILQRGVIADDSGAIRFIIRNNPGAEPLVENQWYTINGAVVDRYRGTLSMQIPPGSAEPLEEDTSIRPNIIPITQAGPGIVCLRVKMVQEYESTSDRLLQAGILGDESGTIRFTIWKDDNSVRLDPDTVYSIYYASVDEFNSRLSVTLNGATCIPEENVTMQVRTSNEEVCGAFVHLSPGSGLIKRCPVEGCGRVLSRQNYCPVHEIQPNYVYDLRVKGWLDTGVKTYDTIISREGVEELTGLNLISAQEMAENDPLGLETVFYHMNEQILGRYLVCRGRSLDNRFFAYNCEYQKFDSGLLAELINRVEGESHE